MDTARKFSTGRPARPATWAIIALLAVIAGCLVVQAGLGTASANGVGAVDSSDGFAGRNIQAVAGQIGPKAYGLFLIDRDNATIMAYEFTKGGTLGLASARTFVYDCRLDQYNTELAPRQIKEVVERGKRLGDVDGGNK